MVDIAVKISLFRIVVVYSVSDRTDRVSFFPSAGAFSGRFHTHSHNVALECCPKHQMK